MVQLADYDVNCIIPFKRTQNSHFHQNERFSIIRWGSQTDLIIPRKPNLELEFLQKIGVSVEAGLDKIIKIKKI